MADENNTEQVQPEVVTVPPIEASAPVAEPVAPATGAIADIGERMGAASQGATDVQQQDSTIPEEAPAFDLSKLRPEQLQQLKAMLASTPERATVKRGNPIVLIRRLNGQIIVDFKNAINTLVRDELTNITSEVLIIPVKYLGTNGFVNVNYRDFMNADQVKCQVINVSRKEEWVPEDVGGEPIVSKETGRPIERGYTVVHEVFTIKLPEGTQPETADVEGKVVNA